MRLLPQMHDPNLTLEGAERLEGWMQDNAAEIQRIDRAIDERFAEIDGDLYLVYLHKTTGKAMLQFMFEVGEYASQA